MTDSSDWAARTEAQVLDAALPLIPRLGFTSTLVRRAAEQVGLTAPEAELLLPGGPRDLAALLSYRHDEAGIAALAPVDPKSLKIRQRIAQAVQARVDAAMADGPALRRWLGYLCLPQNLALGARLSWKSADAMWRWAGDGSTDENHYSKRAILAALLGSTLAVRASSSPAAASKHLERGIEAVMGFETLKARISPRDLSAAAAEALGRARYGGRTSAPEEPVTPA